MLKVRALFVVLILVFVCTGLGLRLVNSWSFERGWGIFD